jgi:hypothetical protein
MSNRLKVKGIISIETNMQCAPGKSYLMLQVRQTLPFARQDAAMQHGQACGINIKKNHPRVAVAINTYGCVQAAAGRWFEISQLIQSGVCRMG